jgi:hypothetical protein
MLVLLAVPVAFGVVTVHRYLQVYAPSNVLIRRARSSPSRWRTAAALVALALALLIVMHGIAYAIAGGAPEWLHLVVLVLAWDSIKLVAAGGLVAASAVKALLLAGSNILRPVASARRDAPSAHGARGASSEGGPPKSRER